MFFPPTQRHAPQRNVLPNGSSRDTTARREIARLSALVEELKRSCGPSSRGWRICRPRSMRSSRR
jgi:hypothetical protein